MSHHSRLETRIVSARHLVSALEDLGIKQVEVYGEARPLQGWMGEETAVGAHVIVRRETRAGLDADLGFVRGADGRFELLLTDMDRVRYDARWLQRLTRRYAFHVATSMLTEQGFDLVEQKEEADGSVRLTLRRTA